MSTRRTFLTGSAGVVAAALATRGSSGAETIVQPCAAEIASLCGEWFFRTDPQNVGTKENWYVTTVPARDWRRVTVPHTWQVEAPLADYRGIAWYWSSFETPAAWHEGAVRVEFEAVFHSATV